MSYGRDRYKLALNPNYLQIEEHIVLVCWVSNWLDYELDWVLN